MRQTGTHQDPRAQATPQAKVRKPDITLKEAAIVLAVTGAVSVAIGLLPHFR